MSPRRSDTRDRIQQVALKLFTEKGYDNTSLREIAELLDVTKAALYYHFKSKEEILESVAADIKSSVQELIEWAEAQPQTLESRKQILHRLSDLLESRWRPMIRFAQANQTRMQTLKRGEESMEQIRRLFALFRTPGASSTQAFRSVLAVVALLLASAPTPLLPEIKGNISDVAIEVAEELISP